MNIKYNFLAIIIAILCQICCASKLNISLSELETCEVYYSDATHNNFRHFFNVSSMKKSLNKDNERLHLKFYVMNSNAFIILLSEVVRPSCNDPFCERRYEIALGTKNSVIWTNLRRGSDAVLLTRGPSLIDVLSNFDPIPVEVIQTNAGEVIVNIPGYAEPLMKYLDKNPMDIKFFSFGSPITPAKWFYNCQFDENSNIESQKKSENGIKTVETFINQQKFSEQLKSIANLAEKNNEEQLLASKLSAKDMKELMEYFVSGFRPSNRHISFCSGLVPTLDNFDDNQVVKFQLGVIELMQQIKNPTTTTTTTEKPMPKIDIRIGQ
ncbi:uncharacterized protein LOC129914788 isoform X2 [Episyrphus balteatus]|uniref:uncharacterized protein LOC129914788 isoform X2 n=1 Tax=Episyrphus balteatus TaxID=286459 RepID=UPI002484E66E|nr:uncharacterized protein LOC129914788 isoform X2 [Episyrphus balteatus]